MERHVKTLKTLTFKPRVRWAEAKGQPSGAGKRQEARAPSGNVVLSVRWFQSGDSDCVSLASRTVREEFCGVLSRQLCGC